MTTEGRMRYMGKIYELTSGDVDNIIESIIQNNGEIKEWADKDKQVIKAALESIFYSDDMEKDEDIYQSYEQQYYGTGKKAGLYFKDTDTHICVRDIVLEFIKIIFSPNVWSEIVRTYCELKKAGSSVPNVGAIVDLISKIKKIITHNVIKLTEEKLCFYLQIITHFREHNTVNVDEILEWLPEKECCWCSAVLECEFREDTHCLLKSKENCSEIVQTRLNEMVDSKVLMENVSQKGEYKINY